MRVWSPHVTCRERVPWSAATACQVPRGTYSTSPALRTRSATGSAGGSAGVSMSRWGTGGSCRTGATACCRRAGRRRCHGRPSGHRNPQRPSTTLPLDEEALERSENIGDVVALVEQLQTAPDDCPERWATESGPADRAALDLFCLLALRSGSPLLSLDVPHAALATGHGRSTMHHAFGRLRLDSWLGRTTDNGPAGTYELLPVTASHPAFEPVARGGTQGNPPPQGIDGPP